MPRRRLRRGSRIGQEGVSGGAAAGTAGHCVKQYRRKREARPCQARGSSGEFNEPMEAVSKLFLRAGKRCAQAHALLACAIRRSRRRDPSFRPVALPCAKTLPVADFDDRRPFKSLERHVAGGELLDRNAINGHGSYLHVAGMAQIELDGIRSLLSRRWGNPDANPPIVDKRIDGIADLAEPCRRTLHAHLLAVFQPVLRDRLR